MKNKCNRCGKINKGFLYQNYIEDINEEPHEPIIKVLEELFICEECIISYRKEIVKKYILDMKEFLIPYFKGLVFYFLFFATLEFFFRKKINGSITFLFIFAFFSIIICFIHLVIMLIKLMVSTSKRVLKNISIEFKKNYEKSSYIHFYINNTPINFSDAFVRQRIVRYFLNKHTFSNGKESDAERIYNLSDKQYNEIIEKLSHIFLSINDFNEIENFFGSFIKIYEKPAYYEQHYKFGANRDWIKDEWEEKISDSEFRIDCNFDKLNILLNERT